MSEPFEKAIPVGDIASGGMAAIEIGGREIVVCNAAGTFYAIGRRCGHMSAPLERGTLAGSIVTCPMHCAQFDASTGEPLSGPIPEYVAGEQPPPRIAAFLRNATLLRPHVRTESIASYPVKVDSGWVWVAQWARSTCTDEPGRSHGDAT